MTTDANGHDSRGRFERIEGKLDALLGQQHAFELSTAIRLAKLEDSITNMRDQAEAARDRTVSDRTYFWMRVGIVVTFLVGAATFVLRLFGL